MLTPYLTSVVFTLVAANPILQRIPIQIPGQSYPVPTCPTCPTQTCPSQTCPTQTCPSQTCPTQTCPSQTCPAAQPCQTCQNQYRSVFNPQPMAPNHCPCNKQMMQNTAPPVNQDVLSQLILRRILSQPQAQAGLVQTCNQCEAQKVPNIINNYIIIPPEYFKGNETAVKREESVKRRKGKRRRKQSRHRTEQGDHVCPCKDNGEQRNDKNIVEELIAPCACNKENTSKSKSDKIVQEGNIDSAPVPNAETINDKIPKNTRPNDQEARLENNPVNAHKSKKRNREETKSLEEAIIRDFCRKNPSIPKEIARSLLDNLKQKVKEPEKSYYSPYPFSPFGFSPYNPELFYPRYDVYEGIYNDRVQGSKAPRRRKQHRSRNKKPKEETKVTTDDCDKKCQKMVEVNPSVINIEKETITTEKITATTENKFKEKNIKDSETQMETPDDLLDQLDQMKAKFAKLNEIETTTVGYKRVNSYPELGKEDKVPTVYDNGVDDYYPDFRGDNIAFYGSDEECDNEEKRYVNTNKPNKPNKYESSTEHSLPVSTESYDSYEESMNDKSAEIQFRIPPRLELPDFETIQINKYSQEINSKFVADDSNSYSDAKADSRAAEIEMKPAKVFTKDKSGRTNIETMYGHSRVMRYGQDAEAAGSEPVITYYLPEEAMTEDRIQMPDGERVVVVAKSIRDLEDGRE